MRKWGPSTRNIVRSFKYQRDQLDPFEDEVRQAASSLGQNLWNTLGGQEKSFFPQGTASAVVFIRRKVKDHEFAHDFSKSDRFIPTPHLVKIFEEYQARPTELRFLEAL